MYCRRLGGLVGVGCGLSGKFRRNLDESVAKNGFWRGGGGLLWWPVAAENGRILNQNDGF